MLVGASGVGKSTFINAFANYITYDSFEDAKKHGPISVIHSSFEFQIATGGKMEPIRVETGEQDPNEGGVKASDSNTQHPCHHQLPISFPGGSILVNLFDTPGMLDTRGISQDETNCRNIIKFLSQFDRLHGIIFLLKSGETRLNKPFEYCLKEILTQFHKSASTVIRFVYTHSAGQFFTPGETYNMVLQLQEEIKHIPLNVHDEPLCVDSQAFRYLALLETMKKPQYQKPEYDKVKAALAKHERTYNESWTNSTEAVKTVFQQFFTVEPHDIGATLLLNKVRDQILQLTKPMGEVHIAIENEKMSIQVQITEISKNGGNIDALEKNKMGKAIETVKLPRPMTVCRKCSKDVKDDFGIVVSDYPNPCHDPCCIGEVMEHKLEEPKLQHCACMTGECGNDGPVCKCGHSWRVHMHTVTKLVWVQKIRPEIEQQITDLKKGVNNTEKNIETLKAKMKEMEQEQKLIVETSAQCAIFLGQNSIFPYNSATEDYMKMMIDSQTKSGGASSPVVIALKDQLEHFRNVKSTLQKNLDSCTVGGIVGASKNMYDNKAMQTCINDLHKLKHFGSFFSKSEEPSISFAQLPLHHARASRPVTDQRKHTFVSKANFLQSTLDQVAGGLRYLGGYK
jgi:hypothetical protein